MSAAPSRAPLVLCALLGSGALHADEAALEVITVVGSNIAGGGAAEALSVVTVDQEEIDSTGATNGNELFRSLPQFGDVSFTEKSSTNQGRNSNAPRGDISSINLHSICTSTSAKIGDLDENECT